MTKIHSAGRPMYADAGYELAIETARALDVNMPSLDE